MSTEVERFYDLLKWLAEQPAQGSRLSELSGSMQLPERGVYFFFEPGERRALAPEQLRVVRVGTHAVSIGSRSTLWSRLRTHRGTRTGSGSHRSSIFRLHVGAALLARDDMRHDTWGVGSSAPMSIRLQEVDLEHRVSNYLGGMSVVWVDVPDAPGPASTRSFLERNSIALLSNACQPHDPPSPTWLGRASPRDPIRQSGLWNLNYVSDSYDPRFMDVFEAHIARTANPSAHVG